MPFTFSHPAIVLPLTYLSKRWYSLTGLIIGSMAPDFEYFIRMKDKSIYSHTFFGLFYFDLPVGLVLAFVYHQIVRNPLIQNLPVTLKGRFIGFTSFNWHEAFRKHWLVIIVSIFVGAGSHLLWDNFTHYKGFFVLLFPSLKHFFRAGHHYSIRYYNLIQHISSVTGLIIVLIAIYKMPVAENYDREIDYLYWLLVLFISLVLVTTRFFLDTDKRIGDVVMTVISGGLWALVLAPILYKRVK